MENNDKGRTIVTKSVQNNIKVHSLYGFIIKNKKVEIQYIYILG
jgi:hypothetical protein